jgi:CheY-like chemotaxis protein
VTLQRVFEPFFTTKPAGKGTGLGMAMVYGLMKQHGGFVGVASQVGEGTTVQLCFPVARAARTTPVATAQPREAVDYRGTETVLVVDDEEALRRTAQRILEKHGYRVLVAGDGEAALRILRERGRSVDLVFTDLMMPRLGGAGLVREATRTIGPVRFLVASGYAATDSPDRDQVPPNVPFIRKPWTLVELLEGVRAALDNPTAEGGQA